MYQAKTDLRFYAFQHPYACKFIDVLQKGGISALLTLSNQRWRRDTSLGQDTTATFLAAQNQGLFFATHYEPTTEVGKPYPAYNVDFGNGGAYSQYNWELFFHMPLLIATRLMQDGRHEEALKWFHYIFNPTTSSNDPIPQRYWFCKPLRDAGKPETIKALLQSLKPDGTAKGELETSIKEWRDYPFEPHRIARRRPGAYQKAVVMKYLDNLIAWGDTLFLRDTIEALNEATQLYVLAARILGPRAQRVPALTQHLAATYADLRPKLDAFSNALVQIENMAQPFTPAPVKNADATASLQGIDTLYFCVPPNDNLLQYWDTVADRLFKIRNCMNIEGIVRELPLFEPPIDPALLVRARALGLDLASILDDLSAPEPQYRVMFMLQKAREFCEELKQFGGLLLAAVEKKDAEQLAQIRAGHEKALLQAIHEVKKQQVKEAENTLFGLEQAREHASIRQQFFSSRPFTIAGEQEQLLMLVLSTGLQTAGQMFQLAASFAHSWPDQFIGAMAGTGGGGIHLSRVTGGSSAGAGLQASGRAMEILAGVAQAAGSASGIMAGYRRRADDWKFQADLASTEVKQLDKQIVAADIRRQICERELANHELQIEQSQKVEDFLREKFTNQELYGWLSSQVAAVYFQAYRLAYDMAKRAERAYRMELDIEKSNFIQFGAWESQRKGLLAGERLSLDLRRLEAAYLDQNKRRYELTRHVSLARLDPGSLIQLRQTGACEIRVPEELFDLDYPGHYMRRIKSVGLTIPSVTGPYTTVSCTLTLLEHAVRRDSNAGSGAAALQTSFTPVQSIATSGGRNDAGVFELNFHEERRLPFEGAGVISKWRIELPAAVRQFDYDTISDVILHFNYTALEGGTAFRTAREKQLTASLAGQGTSPIQLHAAFSLRHDFPTEWHLLRQGQAASLTIGRDRFPYFAGVMKLKIEAASWIARTTSGLAPALSLKTTATATPVAIEWNAKDETTGLIFEKPVTPPTAPHVIPLDEQFVLSSTSGDDLNALWLLVRYIASAA